jgi:poly(hydroxyalkanoate) depolymerase family esterase
MLRRAGVVAALLAALVVPIGSRASAVVPVRSYLVHSGGSAALVVAMHGCTQTPADMEGGTGWDQLADKAGFTVVYPEQSTGIDGNAARCWNSGQAAAVARGDGELEAVAEITRTVAAQYAVPANRIYMVGISSGALMANVMAATYPDLYAAFASVEGCSYMCSDPTGDVAYTRMGPYARVMPVFVVQGTADYLTNPAMGELTVAQWLGTDDLADDGHHNQSVSARPARIEQHDFGVAGHARPWHRDACFRYPRNPCTLSAAGVSPYPTTVRKWNDSHGRVVIEAWTVHGLSHNYSGGSYGGSFTDPYGPNITTPIWRFFWSHPLR